MLRIYEFPLQHAMESFEPIQLVKTSCWFAESYPTEQGPCNLTLEQIRALQTKLSADCRAHYEEGLWHTHEGRVSLDYWKRMEESGTRADRCSLAVLRLKECPFGYVSDLDVIKAEYTRSKRAATDLLGTLASTLETLVPRDRCLVRLETRLSPLLQAGQCFKAADTVLMALFEDTVLRFCTDILTYIVDQCADDVLEQVRISAVRALGVLSQYASFGKACVRALVRKLGDVESKVVRAAAGCLVELEREEARVEAVSQCLLFM